MKNFSIFQKRPLLATAASVVGSMLLVASVAYGITYVATSYVGVGTSTPGAALSITGAGLIEGGFTASFLKSTSTVASSFGGNLGIGTTTPSVTLGINGIGVEGAAIIGNFIYTSFITATSTTATSTFYGGVKAGSNGGLSSAAGLTITGGDLLSSGQLKITTTGTSTISGLTAGTTNLVSDASSGSLGVATSTFPEVQTSGSASANSRVNVSVGAGSATTTLYIAGGAGVGSSIILVSSDGSGCVAIMATRAGAALDAAATLSVKVVPCPKP